MLSTRAGGRPPARVGLSSPCDLTWRGGAMLSFIVRRLLVAIPLILLSPGLVFLLVANAGARRAEVRGRNPPVPPQVIENRERQLELDKRLPTRYVTWLGNFVQGDMGTSVRGVEVRP